MPEGIPDDSKWWVERQQEQEQAWEQSCRHCGACCGHMDGDPCEQLLILEDGRSSCRVYAGRFGRHRTRSGKEFHCVSIREILHEPWPGHWDCAYRRVM